MKKDFLFLFYMLAGIIAGSIIASLCTNAGVFDEKFTKKDKVSYQKARKIKINELM